MLAVTGCQDASRPEQSASPLQTATWCDQTGAAETANRPPLNLLIVLVDTLRADRLGCYGYDKRTSPFLDRLAAEGVVFERAISPSSYTREAVAALFEGRYPHSSPWGQGWNACPEPDYPGLASLYAAAGYRTGLLSNTPMLHRLTFEQDFDVYELLVTQYNVSGQGHRLSARALEFVDNTDERPFALYVHYLDPHSPYNARSERYPASDYRGKPLHLSNDVAPNVPELVADGFGPGDPRFDDLSHRYDAEINYVDGAIEVLLRGLCDRGVLNNTLVMVTSDHGEEFLEHGFVEHAWQIYTESVHVPLILWAPGRLAPARVSEPVSLVDMLPTALAQCDVAHDPGRFEGSNLFHKTEDGAWQVAPRQAPVFSGLAIQHRAVWRSVWTEDYAYLAAVKPLEPAGMSEIASTHAGQMARVHAVEQGNVPSIPMDAPAQHEALYALDTDFPQRRNIAESEPEVLENLRAILEKTDYVAPVPEPQKKDRFAKRHNLVTPEDFESLEEQMRALGYLGGAEETPDAAQNGETAP